MRSQTPTHARTHTCTIMLTLIKDTERLHAWLYQQTHMRRNVHAYVDGLHEKYPALLNLEYYLRGLDVCKWQTSNKALSYGVTQSTVRSNLLNDRMSRYFRSPTFFLGGGGNIASPRSVSCLRKIYTLLFATPISFSQTLKSSAETLLTRRQPIAIPKKRTFQTVLKSGSNFGMNA